MSEAPKARASKRLSALLRLGVYLLTMAAFSGLWLFHRAHAELSERALLVGRELTRVQPELGVTRLELNGAQLALSALVVPEPVDDVLARFSGACQRPDVQADLALLRERGQKLPPSETFGVFRSVPGELEGTAACFVSSEQGGVKAMAERALRALETGDLSALGQARYVYAKRSQGGAATQVITAWSEGALEPARMFPEHGDAPGHDLVDGVRPPHARRLLSARGVDQKLQLALYESQSDSAQVLRRFDQQLAWRGYQSVESAALDEVVPVPARVYRQGERDELVVLSERRGEQTLVFSFRVGTHGNVLLAR